MDHWTVSTPFRLGLGLGYLVLVNLISGYLAETFRYASLWGNRDEVFFEYSVPFLFTYALSHLVTMLPLTILVIGMPTWSERMLIQARWIALAVLLACLMVELSERITRFQKIPFVLFIAVDAGLFLILALCFKPPVRVVIITIITLGLVVGGALFYRDTVINPERYERNVKNVNPKTPTQVALQSPAPLIEEVNLVVDYHAGELTYYMPLSVTIDIDEPPDFDAICNAAELAFDQALASDPPPQARSTSFAQPTVRFMARAAFEPNPNIYYPSGHAYRTRTGKWICSPAFPVAQESHE